MSKTSKDLRAEMGEIIDEMLTDGFVDKKAFVWESKFRIAIDQLEALFKDYRRKDEKVNL